MLSVVTGSRAYGLATDASDTDRRGVFAAPAALFWRLDKPPTHLDGPLPEQFSWEIERFVTLALAANPTVLECLWSPLREVVTPVGEELLALRTAFLSERARDTFLHYARTQLRRAENHARTHGGEIRWKHVMHLLRLLESGAHLVRHGEPLVEVGALREPLLAVRRGEVPWPDVTAWRDRLTTQITTGPSALPATPDRTRAENFLTDVRRRSLAA